MSNTTKYLVWVQLALLLIAALVLAKAYGTTNDGGTIAALAVSDAAILLTMVLIFVREMRGEVADRRNTF
ncbi:hypothetical protein IAU60_002600 [Kwoniella sp. DSM 27419]